MKLDISTPDLTRAAIRRALHNKQETRRLLVALGACQGGRRRHAGQTLAEAWWSPDTDHRDLYWLIANLRARLYPNEHPYRILDRLDMISDQLCPCRPGKTRTKLYRAWFTLFGELQWEWNL